MTKDLITIIWIIFIKSTILIQTQYLKNNVPRSYIYDKEQNISNAYNIYLNIK